MNWTVEAMRGHHTEARGYSDASAFHAGCKCGFSREDLPTLRAAESVCATHLAEVYQKAERANNSSLIEAGLIEAARYAVQFADEYLNPTLRKRLQNGLKNVDDLVVDRD